MESRVGRLFDCLCKLFRKIGEKMRDIFTGSTIESLEKSIDIFVKANSTKLTYFKRDYMPIFRNGVYYLDVEYKLLDHQVKK